MLFELCKDNPDKNEVLARLNAEFSRLQANVA
jgi:hypothetical protein